MSVSKFFRNFLTLPQMGVKKSSCHETRETEHQDNDPKIQKTQMVSLDDECNSRASSNTEICEEIDYQDFEICHEETMEVVKKGDADDLSPSECYGSFGVNHPLCKVSPVQSVVMKQRRRKFSAITDLKEHVAIHSGEKPFKCAVCQRQFRLKQYLLQHMISHKERRKLLKEDADDTEESEMNQVATSPRKDELIQCNSKAEMKTINEPILSSNDCAALVELSPDNAGIVDSCYNSPPFRLEESEVQFESILTTAQSMTCVDSVVALKRPPGAVLLKFRHVFYSKGKEKPFMCGYCGKEYKTRHSVYAHIRLHHEEKRYSCEFCGKRFAQPSDLTNHTRIHTQEKPFSCDQCGMQFRFDASLRYHKTTHSEERLFSCDKCSKSFKTRGALSQHKETHQTVEQRNGVVCDVCKRKFSWPALLKEHMLIHTGEKPFKCTLCEKQFRRKIGLRNHMGTHSGHNYTHSEERLFQCNQCSKLFMTRDGLTIHEKSHNIDDQRECNICKMKFSAVTDLKEHMTMHSGEKPFKCTVCQRQFHLKQHLWEHMISHKERRKLLKDDADDTEESEMNVPEHYVTSPSKAESIQCNSKAEGKTIDEPILSSNDCAALVELSPDNAGIVDSCYNSPPFQLEDSEVPFESNLTTAQSMTRTDSVVALKRPPGAVLLKFRHVFYTKGKEKPFLCGYCGKAYKTRRSVYAHIRLHHEEKRYSCEFCGKRYAQPSDLAAHVRIHTQEKPFSCDQCGKLFRCDTNLRIHKYTHSEERLFSCDKCSKSYKTRDMLSRHNESHQTKEQRKGVACDICKRKFSFPSLLKEHMMIHTGEKPFKCTLCKKQFRKKIQLRNHLDTHNGTNRRANKPCSVCGKILWASRLPEHMRMHAGEKPFECNICGKRFPKKQNLEGHMRSHTGEKPFACDRCDKRFALYSNMVTHKAKCAVHSNTLA